MIASLLRVTGSTRWTVMSETPEQLILEATAPTPGDFEDIFSFVAAGTVDLRGYVDRGLLYHLDLSGYPCFNEDLDELWRAIFGDCHEQIVTHRRRIAAMRDRSLPMGSAFTELELFHHVSSEAGTPVKCRLVVHKTSLIKLCPQSDIRPHIWFSSVRFLDWLETSSGSLCLDLFAAALPPAFYVAADSSTFAYDTLVRPIEDLQISPDIDLCSFRRQHASAYRMMRRNISLESDAPIIHPSLFANLAPSSWNIDRFREAAAYAVLCSFSMEVTLDGSGYCFTYKAPVASKTTRVIFHSGTLKVPGTNDTIPLTRDRLESALDTCALYTQSIAESDSLRGVWNLVLERAVGGNLARIFLDPSALRNSFKEFKDTLLKSNVDKLLSTHEKAQGAVIQTASQITKDVDGLGGEVEKAVLTGVGSGVLTVLGSLLKIQPLDIAAPTAMAMLALLFFPNVFGRIHYLETSLGHRDEDLHTFLDALTALAQDSINLKSYQVRFGEHMRLAYAQVKSARARVTLLFVLLHTAAIAASVATTIRAPGHWTSYVPAGVVCAYSICVSLRDEKVPHSIIWYLWFTPAVFAVLAVAHTYLHGVV